MGRWGRTRFRSRSRGLPPVLSLNENATHTAQGAACPVSSVSASFCCEFSLRGSVAPMALSVPRARAGALSGHEDGRASMRKRPAARADSACPWTDVQSVCRAPVTQQTRAPWEGPLLRTAHLSQTRPSITEARVDRHWRRFQETFPQLCPGPGVLTAVPRVELSTQWSRVTSPRRSRRGHCLET